MQPAPRQMTERMDFRATLNFREATDVTGIEVRGGEDADTLAGGPGDDTLFGLGGDDLLLIHDGEPDLLADLFLGGRDTLYGGAGDDVFGMEPRPNFVQAHVLDDTLYGGEGHDVLRVNGTARLAPSVVFDSIEALEGDGARLLLGNRGVYDFSGFETLGDVEIVGGGRRTTLILTEGDDRLTDSDAGVVIAGGGDDLIRSASHERVLGGEGDDVLIASGWPTLFDGGEGHDVLRLRGWLEWTGEMRLESVEEIDGDGAVLRVVGRGGADFTGLGLHDLKRIEAQAPRQTIVGTEGDDRIVAGGGRHTLHGGRGDDILEGGGADDACYGGAGDDVLIFRGKGRAGDTLDGGRGHDTLRLDGEWNPTSKPTLRSIEALDGAGEAIRMDGGRLDLSGFETVERVKLIQGSLRREVIVGSGDDDRIRGEGGRDRIVAGDGDDVILGARDGGRVDGGAGFDTFRPAERLDVGTRFRDIEKLEAGGDLRLVGEGRFRLDAFETVDLQGRTVLRGPVRVVGTQADERFQVDAPGGRVKAGGGDDEIVARGGAWLSGGQGADLFVLDLGVAHRGGQRWRIADFDVDEDRLDLDAGFGGQEPELVARLTGRPWQMVFRDGVLKGDGDGDRRLDGRLDVLIELPGLSAAEVEDLFG